MIRDARPAAAGGILDKRNDQMQDSLEGGYDDNFSVAITAASSTIGPIFPPSIPMVIFGLVAELSIGRLFLGGVVPGLFMTVPSAAFDRLDNDHNLSLFIQRS